MRLVLTFLAMGALAACNHDTPNDGNVEDAMPVSEEVTAEILLDEDGNPIPQEEVKIVVIDNNNPEISNTQDFGETSENLSIEDDKALLKAQRDKFKVIEPTALPKRNGKTESIVAFALQSKNAVGEKIYSRVNPLGATLAKKNCPKYRSADDAQLAFLKAGGPKRDAKNLDPDGDGFACGWSPEPYRTIVN
ncbi:MAG: hypothetical protein ACI861_000612 [Paracoccaceae bacterium]|jgi:hypothetical protein